MRANNIRTIWANGGTVINGWLAIPSSISAELMALQDWDSICIDLQHGAIGYETAITMLQAISTTSKTPIVRVPANESGIIGKVLDAGAYGVICPMVNTRAEAESFVRACRYAPLGHRSVGPLRASLYAGADYVKNANSTVLAMPMIESAEAVKNLDAILATPGLDSVYVGPSDLSVSMGENSGFDPEYKDVLKAIELIAERSNKAGVMPGIHVGSVAYAKRCSDMGYRLITYLSDFRMLQQAVARSLTALRAFEPQPGVA